MKRLEERTEGLDTCFSLRVPAQKAEAVRRHLSSLLELMSLDDALEDEREELFDGLAPGQRLKKFRQERRLTQKHLAELLGTTQARISDMEQGIRPIPPESAVRLGEAFGVSARHFIR